MGHSMGYLLIGALLCLFALLSETDSLTSPPDMSTKAQVPPCGKGTLLGDLSIVNASCHDPEPSAVCSDCLSALMKTVPVISSVKGKPITSDILVTCAQRMIEMGAINSQVAFKLTECQVDTTKASCPVAWDELSEDLREYLNGECNPKVQDTPGYEFCVLCRPGFLHTLYSIPGLNPSNPSMVISCAQMLTVSFTETTQNLSDAQKHEIWGCFNQSFPGVPVANISFLNLPQDPQRDGPRGESRISSTTRETSSAVVSIASGLLLTVVVSLFSFVVFFCLDHELSLLS